MPSERPIIALIPARGGSKGIAGKNLVEVGGRSLIGHAIHAGLASARIGRVVVTSDATEVLTEAERLGAEALERPVEFATDTATAADVVRHFAEILEAELKNDSVGVDPLIVYLQPTSPLRTAQHVDDALALFEASAASGARGVVSVMPFEPSPYKALKLDDDGRLSPLFPLRVNANRQELPKTFVQNGAIYAFPLSEVRRQAGFPSEGMVPFVMSRDESLDVDTPEDLEAVRTRMQD